MKACAICSARGIVKKAKFAAQPQSQKAGYSTLYLCKDHAIQALCHGMPQDNTVSKTPLVLLTRLSHTEG